MNSDERTNKLLYLAILSQSLIDEIDDNYGLFKFGLKNTAKKFQKELLSIMDNDFGDADAVNQLVNLTMWLRQVHDISRKVELLPSTVQKSFQIDWEELLTKYNL